VNLHILPGESSVITAARMPNSNAIDQGPSLPCIANNGPQQEMQVAHVAVKQSTIIDWSTDPSGAQRPCTTQLSELFLLQESQFRASAAAMLFLSLMTSLRREGWKGAVTLDMLDKEFQND
jgi:hypothetical protein